MKLIHARRLLRLARNLARVPATEFNIKAWKAESSCGTQCCAMGHAAADPVFQRAGLGYYRKVRRFNWHFNEHVVEYGVRMKPDSPQEKARCRSAYQDNYGDFPPPRQYEGYQAGAVFFGLSTSDSYHLFSPDYYEQGEATPKVVAKRIRELVKEKVGPATYRKLVRRKKAAVAA